MHFFPTVCLWYKDVVSLPCFCLKVNPGRLTVLAPRFKAASACVSSQRWTFQPPFENAGILRPHRAQACSTTLQLWGTRWHTKELQLVSWALVQMLLI